MVTIRTSLGEIKVELFSDEAPVTVENFLSYVDDGHYNGTIFHRVIDNFMVQCGGFDEGFRQLPTKSPIKNEADNRLPNETGTLAMARTSDVDSATCQFFINVSDNDFLNYRSSTPEGFGYCVFGKVADGMDVVNMIKAVPTAQHGPHGDVPVDNVVIHEVVRD
ncbi:MAG: peptidylprolyl isomerase [Victivallales bacterium]|nr:peptidylprolyl isomerase [Victivallales bacterium]